MNIETLNTVTLSREEFDRIEAKPRNYQFWVLDRIQKGNGYVYTYSLYKGDIPVGIGDVVSALPDSMRAQKGGFRASAFCLSAEKPDKPSEATFADYQTLVNSTGAWKSRPFGEAERGMYWWVSYHWFVGDGEVLDGGDEWTDPIRATGIEGIGVKGDRGAKGDQGDRGEKGVKGDKGSDGKNGKDVVAFFHSGVEKPEAPTNNEPTNGWQRVCATDSRWMCVGTGENGTSLTWGEPVQVKGTILNYNDENGYIEDEFGNRLGLAFSPVYWIDAESVIPIAYNGDYVYGREALIDESGQLQFGEDGKPLLKPLTLDVACYISTPKGTRRKLDNTGGYRLHCKVRDTRPDHTDVNEFNLEFTNGAWVLPLEDWYNKDRKTNFIELHLMREGESQPLAIKLIEAVKDGRIVKIEEVKAHELPYTAQPTVSNYGTTFGPKLDFGIPKGAPGTSVFAVQGMDGDFVLSTAQDPNSIIVVVNELYNLWPAYKYAVRKQDVRVVDALVPQPRKADIVVGRLPESPDIEEYWSFKVGYIGVYYIGLTKVARITGDKGVQGDTYTPVVGSVKTLAPNSPATVQAVSDPEALTTRFNFGIPKGEQGIQGIQGEQGVQGVQGERGVQGVQGERGEQGIQGIQGERGEKGEKGDAFEIKHVYTSVQEMNDRMAEDALPVGSFVLINTGNVEDPDNAKLYVKAENEYRYLTDMSGAQGIQGERGPQGIQGERGEQGLQGEQGIQGIQGERGPQGVQGEQGLPGVNGTNGTNGITYTPKIKTVTTLEAGSEATALGMVEGSDFNIHLGIPRGLQGVQGIQGQTGAPGLGVAILENLSTDMQFVPTKDGYFVNNNARTGVHHNKAAVARLWFYAAKSGYITFSVRSYGESGCDYGIIGLVDTALLTNNTIDSNKFYANTQSSSNYINVRYNNIPAGYHFIDMKYRKDGSVDGNDDTFQFKIIDSDIVWGIVPQGIQGERGPQGIQGERGEQGLQGEQGIQGIQGERGPQGIQGERGLQGPPNLYRLNITYNAMWQYYSFQYIKIYSAESVSVIKKASTSDPSYIAILADNSFNHTIAIIGEYVNSVQFNRISGAASVRNDVYTLADNWKINICFPFRPLINDVYFHVSNDGSTFDDARRGVSILPTDYQSFLNNISKYYVTYV